jgi:hypothetical protein
MHIFNSSIDGKYSSIDSFSSSKLNRSKYTRIKSHKGSRYALLKF